MDCMDVGTEVIDIQQFVFSERERKKKANSLTMCMAIDLCRSNGAHSFFSSVFSLAKEEAEEMTVNVGKLKPPLFTWAVKNDLLMHFVHWEKTTHRGTSFLG